MSVDAKLSLREAGPDDLARILELLRDDVLGATREAAEDGPYEPAFRAILKNPASRILLAELDGRVVGCAQIDILPGLSLRATTRANIEGVRIASDLRGSGLGQAFFALIEAFCRAEGAGIMQLATNRSRAEAIRFYEGLGFTPSHIGLKKPLD